MGACAACDGLCHGLTRLAQEETGAEKGISLAALEKQALAERLAREAARKAKRKHQDASGAEAKRGKVTAEDAASPAGWLAPGIVVKVVTREPPEVYKAKGASLLLAR